MSTQTSSNAGTDLIRIHKVFTRALAVSSQHSQESGPEPALRDGFQRYERALVSLLNAHHLGEEEIAFPFWEKKNPRGPFNQLIDHHHQIMTFLDKISLWLEMGSTAWETASLAELHKVITELKILWHTHIALEEQYLGSEISAKMLTPEENIQLGNQLAAHGQQHAQPGELVLPFMLYNMPAEDRAVMAQGLPPMVMEQLIPHAWKEIWAPMQPFLLD
jgi:hypothetical protein